MEPTPFAARLAAYWSGAEIEINLIVFMNLLGALVLVVGGLDKLTVVVGPFLIALAVVSFLRQTGGIVAGTEVPFLLVVFGLLLVAARFVPWNRD